MTLAIFTAQLGTASETFIRRHIEEIAPGGVVAIARRSSHAMDGRWAPSCPTLLLDAEERRPFARIGRRLGLSFDGLRDASVTRFIKQHGVTRVLGEYLDQFADFVPLMDRLGIPYVVQGHGIDLSASLLQNGAQEAYLRYSSARYVLTRCEFHRKRLIRLGLPEHLVQVNPGGVDIPPTLPLRAASASKHFLAIGRMTAKKGPVYLLEAFRIAARSDPELTLDYIGGGDFLPAVEQFVSATALGNQVRLHGPASESVKQNLLRRCGVFVQHSFTDPKTGDEEGLPAAIQEAMANGMAVVSTRHSGIPEAVIEGKTGLLVDEKDAQGMAQAFLAVPPIAVRLGEAGYRRAASEYGWEQEKARLRRWLFDA